MDANLTVIALTDAEIDALLDALLDACMAASMESFGSVSERDEARQRAWNKLYAVREARMMRAIARETA